MLFRSPIANSPSPPRPPQKHKSKKAKKPSLPLATPAEPLVLPLGLPRSSKEVAREADGRAIALSTAESYDTPALLKGLQALGLLGEGQGSAVNLVGEAIVRALFRSVLTEQELIESHVVPPPLEPSGYKGHAGRVGRDLHL